MSKPFMTPPVSMVPRKPWHKRLLSTPTAQRLREPSTWAGLAVLGSLLGVQPGTFEAVGQVVGGAAALLAVLLPEGGGNA